MSADKKKDDSEYSSIAHAKLKVVTSGRKVAVVVNDEIDEAVTTTYRAGKIVLLVGCAIAWPVQTLIALGGSKLALHYIAKSTRKNDGKDERALARMQELRADIKARKAAGEFIGAKGPAPAAAG